MVREMPRFAKLTTARKSKWGQLLLRLGSPSHQQAELQKLCASFQCLIVDALSDLLRFIIIDGLVDFSWVLHAQNSIFVSQPSPIHLPSLPQIRHQRREHYYSKDTRYCRRNVRPKRLLRGRC
jgi:hypothetical protein